MDTAEIDAFVARHNANVSTSTYTLWRGAGSRRRLVGRADNPEEAVRLAHENASCAVWGGVDSVVPLLVTGKRTTKKGETYTVEVRGAWAGARLQADVDMMKAAEDGKPSPVSDLRRARRAAAVLRAGYVRINGSLHRWGQLEVRVLEDGTVRVRR